MNPSLRIGTSTRISYFLITASSSVHFPFTPFEFTGYVLDLLLRSPRDVIQFFWPEPYYRSYFKIGEQKGVDFHIIYSKDFVKDHLDWIHPDHVSVFIVDDYNSRIIDLIKQYFTFYYITSSDRDLLVQINGSHADIATLSFYGGAEFFETLKKDKVNILNHFRDRNLYDAKNLPAVTHEVIGKNEFRFTEQNFRPCRTNVFTLNQILGGYWHHRISGEAIQLNQRSSVLVRSCGKLDAHYKQLHERKVLQAEGRGWPFLNPLVLAFPYQSPKYSFNVLYSKKGTEPYLPADLETNAHLYKSMAEAEESLQYQFTYEIPDSFENDPDLDNKMEFMKSHEERELGFIDFCGYLHAGFTFSPVIRFPVVGKSIHKVLEPFAPEEYDDTELIDVNYKYFKRFGIQLREHTFGNDIEEYLENRNGQVIALSDLPVEWLDVRGVPLAFSHDVCRIPTTPPSRMMSQYVSHNFETFKISPHLLGKTLIIFGSPDDDEFAKSYEAVRQTVEGKLPVQLATCRTVAEVVTAVNRFKPELLIFDTHGDYDEKSGSSFLWIGEEKLTNVEVVTHRIGAPIVFLSCCFTNPTYGYLNSIAYAFYDAGAFSVSTTFLPIGIITATTLYIRLLKNLSSAITERIYNNWLGFLSGTIRNSMIAEAMFELTRFMSNPEFWEVFDQAQFTQQHVAWSAKAMQFNRRREAYATWKDVFLNSVKEKYRTEIVDLLTSNAVEPEHLYYSHIGRPDLIIFKST